MLNLSSVFAGYQNGRPYWASTRYGMQIIWMGTYWEIINWPYDGTPVNYTDTNIPVTGWQLIDNTSITADFTVNLGNGEISSFNKNSLDANVTLINTGLNSMTGFRVKSLQKYIGNETFMLTYGDGLSDVNIEELVKFHKSHGKMLTVTAVRAIARFGELEISDDKVMSFMEKPQISQGWING